MNKKLKAVAGNILYFLNVLIVFLLVFENQLAIPGWLQVVGRMHPMLLHFPIVMLLLAMVLEFFRFRTAYREQEFYQSFTSHLLLGGALLSALTVIMGLFLAREEGYEGSVLQWHKWSGVSIVFIASLIYWCRHLAWYKAPLAKAGSFIVAVCLVMAGHFGAALTHGENFLLEPLTKSEVSQVALEEAKIFEHVIQPILQNKCINCHNPEKIKGSLLLTDQKAILKGGKSGKFIVPGKPELSLLLQRIHLPSADKKHMPPSGKVQLSPEEMDLLYLWVKNNADFKKKLIDLPVNDSLRIRASTQFKPADATEEKFDFAAADESIIKKLNNDYRVVKPLARESPALAVNIFNRSAYSAKSLEELTEIKTQVVSLDLHRMPVKDNELKLIAGFENLQHLNLNFTDITGVGLKELVALKKLRSLSLSGTAITYKNMQQISAVKSLTQLTLWNTALKEQDIQQLQAQHKHIQMISGFEDDGKHPVKLNLPQLSNKMSVFKTDFPLRLKHPIKGVSLRYTLDGTEPDSIKSPEFKSGAVMLKKNTTLKVKAYKTGWLSSDPVTFNFYKSSYKPDQITYLSEPNANYVGNGPQTLINERSGLEANFTGNEWIGFQENDMQALLQFRKAVNLSSVALNVMIRPKNFIFPPAKIEVWGGSNKDQLRLLNTINLPPLAKDTKPGNASFVCSFKLEQVNYIKVIAKRQAVPAWHVLEKGKPAPVIQLFVDEILLN